MKKLILLLLITANVFIACNSSRNLSTIQPKTGIIEITAKSEFRMWKDIKHPSFDVVLTNSSATQSCEVYYVKSSGTEKWISPSLQANSSKTITIPKDGHLFLKNFNPNTLTINYKIND